GPQHVSAQPPAAARTELAMHAVQDDTLERHAQLGHLGREVLGIAQALLLRPAHQDEGGLPAAQYLVRPVDPTLKVLEELAHAREEIRYLGERGDARRLLETAEEKPGRPVHGPQRGPSRREVRAQEPADDLPVEKIADAAWCLQEVEGVARGWRVDDDQVVAPALHQHAELLDRHVLVRAGEALREMLIERVGEDPGTRLGGGVPLDQRIPGALLVEHEGDEAAARYGPFCCHAVEGDLPLARTQRLPPERVGQPAGAAARE